MITRRSMLMLAGAAVATGATACAAGAPRTVLRFGAGQADGLYLEFAKLLAAAVPPSDNIRIDPIVTRGSRDNLDELARRRFDMALALADSVYQRADDACAIGRIYENYVQLVVRADDRITRVGDLKGRRAVLGQSGAGAGLTGDRLLRAAGLAPDDVAISYLSLPDSVAALDDDRVDAVLWIDTLPTAAFDVPHRMRLIDLGALVPNLRSAYGDVYQRVRVPPDAYQGGLPTLETIGIANFLMVARTMPDSIAGDLTALLLDHADTLLPIHTVGTQFLDERSLIDTGPIPLHPGAIRIYRKRHG
jgi:TRAP transporter TAXI family solute receptor